MSAIPRSRIEFYSKTLADKGRKSGIAFIEGSSLVPPVDAVVNIRGQDWKVVEVSYSVDHADDPFQMCIRANVFMESAA